MRIRSTNGHNDIVVAVRPKGGVAIEQGHSHVLLDRQGMRALVDALTECATDFTRPPAFNDSRMVRSNSNWELI